jgi:hypothetical protein
MGPVLIADLSPVPRLPVKSVIIFNVEAGVAMPINNWFFDFHLLEQGWISTPPYREDSQKSQPPATRIVTLRMIEFGSEDKPEIWYKAELSHIDSNRTKVTELINRHGLPKAIIVNCWAQKQELEDKLASPD